jgi:hypothetical protein
MKIKNFQKIIIFLTLSVSLSWLEVAIGQPAKIPCKKQLYSLHSGVYDGETVTKAKMQVTFQEVIQVPNTAWLRIYFGDCELGEASYLKITSIDDGAYQRLDSESLKQWQNTSAFFNGKAIKVELCVAPEDKAVFFEIQEILFGERVSNIDKSNKILQDPCYGCGICGGTDDRVSSNDPAIGRMFMLNAAGDTIHGCTGWIASNGSFLSAGHCFGDVGICIDNLEFVFEKYVLEFNVPQSDNDGNPNWAHPNDQYVIDKNNVIFCHGGVGRDWAVFNCFPNSNTDLLPVEAQNAF